MFHLLAYARGASMHHQSVKMTNTYAHKKNRKSGEKRMPDDWLSLKNLLTTSYFNRQTRLQTLHERPLPCHLPQILQDRKCLHLNHRDAAAHPPPIRLRALPVPHLPTDPSDRCCIFVVCLLYSALSLTCAHTRKHTAAKTNALASSHSFSHSFNY